MLLGIHLVKPAHEVKEVKAIQETAAATKAIQETAAAAEKAKEAWVEPRDFQRRLADDLRQYVATLEEEQQRKRSRRQQ